MRRATSALLLCAAIGAAHAGSACKGTLYLTIDTGSMSQAETIARILASQSDLRLHFNYRSEENEVWDDPDLQNGWRYEARYPRAGTEGCRVVL